MIRNLILGEELPEMLRTGFESAKQTDPSWIWIAERDGEKVGIFVAAPAHLAVILMRIAFTDRAHPDDARQMLNAVFDSVKGRGYLGYIVWLNPINRAEKALMSIVKAFGGMQLPELQVVYAGKV